MFTYIVIASSWGVSRSFLGELIVCVTKKIILHLRSIRISHCWSGSRHEPYYRLEGNKYTRWIGESIWMKSGFLRIWSTHPTNFCKRLNWMQYHHTWSRDQTVRSVNVVTQKVSTWKERYYIISMAPCMNPASHIALWSVSIGFDYSSFSVWNNYVMTM